MTRFSLLTLLLLGAAASAQPSTPLTVPDALTEAVETYATLIAEGDVEALATYWNGEAYADRILDGLVVPALEVQAVRRGARRVDLGAKFAEAAALGSFRFLRFVERGGAPRARFRLIGPDGTVKYLDLLFEPDDDGQYRLVDAYDFMQAQDATTLTRRMMEGTYPDGNLTSRDPERTVLVGELIRAVQIQDWHAVIDVYPRITPRDEDRKVLLLFYLQAAGMVAPAQYRKALDLFERDFGDDPDAALVLVDHHFLQGDTEAALAAIDAVDVGVGGDPYLDHLRASLYLLEGRLGEARAAADRLAAAMPDLEDAHYPILDIALAQEDYAAVAAGLTRLERDFGVVFETSVMKAEPAWAGFVASAAYKRWTAARAE